MTDKRDRTVLIQSRASPRMTFKHGNGRVRDGEPPLTLDEHCPALDAQTAERRLRQ